MDFETIIDDVFTQLKETKGTDLFWTEDEVKTALNDTYWEIADTTHCFKTSDIIVMIIGTATYDMPTNYILGSLDRVEFNKKRIFPISIAELDALNEDWRDETGSPEKYILDLGASDEIVVYPKPVIAGASSGIVYGTSVFAASTTSTDPINNLRPFYAKFPTRLSENGDEFLHPVNNNPRKILTKGALAILLMKEGEGKDIEKAAAWYRLFATAMKQGFRREKTEMVHTMRSISGRRIGRAWRRGDANIGSHYPSYYFR